MCFCDLNFFCPILGYVYKTYIIYKNKLKYLLKYVYIHVEQGEQN